MYIKRPKLATAPYRFQVNLQCGEAEGSDIAMHFNPRFDGWDKVVFNSFQNGSWESEDNVQNMPFSKGQAFELVIAVTAEGYQVSEAGRLKCYSCNDALSWPSQGLSHPLLACFYQCVCVY